MKVDWNSQISQLEQISEQLKQISLSTAYTYNGQSLTKKDVDESLQSCLHLLKIQNGNQIDPLTYIIHYPAVVSSAQNALSFLPNFISANASQPTVDNFIGHLWGVFANLNAINTEKFKLDNLERILSKNLSVKDKLDKLVDYDKALNTANSLTKEKIKKLENAKLDTDSILKAIEQNNLETSNLKTLAESNAVQVATTKERIEDLLNEIRDKSHEIEDLKANIEGIRNEAEATLALTSQAALASSFKIRKDSLQKAQVYWIVLFLIGLILLFSFTALSISLSEKFHLPPIIVNEKIEIWGAVVRLLLSSPIIWLTWFSVKQFNSNVALIEDYAFKEASALAFVGYKKDMQSDEQMIKLLSESAIKNFSYAPSRLISPNDPASPMHDLFESALKDKGLFDRLVELLKVLKPTKD